ncbi:hypothetical protein STRIP9103_06529 [Streptomyces ipomoeae 91-03]|uniref:Uncharacterized protein n=1 Tax=Streptomyces ipomoeae 91-03 TaxID=698759 RepID=L1L4V1_9ACTN|nr:hypothetical protein STRIP9103_06529 [Streptomyces ipomoeae 91-03]
MVRAGSTVPGDPVEPVLSGDFRPHPQEWFSQRFAWQEGVRDPLL